MDHQCGIDTSTVRPYDSIQCVPDGVYESIATPSYDTLESDMRLLDHVHEHTCAAMNNMPTGEPQGDREISLTHAYVDGTADSKLQNGDLGPAAAGFCVFNEFTDGSCNFVVFR